MHEIRDAMRTILHGPDDASPVVRALSARFADEVVPALSDLAEALATTPGPLQPGIALVRVELREQVFERLTKVRALCATVATDATLPTDDEAFDVYIDLAMAILTEPFSRPPYLTTQETTP